MIGASASWVLSPPLVGAYYPFPFELRVLILGAVVLGLILYLTRKLNAGR